MRPVPFCAAEYVSLLFPAWSGFWKNGLGAKQPWFQPIRRRLQQCPIDVRSMSMAGSLLMSVRCTLSGTGDCQGDTTSGRHHYNEFPRSGRK